jgi:hypothetical protein
MLAAGRGDRCRTTSTDCHAAIGGIIVPRGGTAVTVATATARSRADSPSRAATSGTSSASPATTAAATTTPAMGECGRYRQGCDSESEREHSKHCHVGTAFLRPGIGLGPLSAPLLYAWLLSARPV